MADTELAFAKDLAQLLNPYGKTSLEYITAEMQPFSNAQRPDVVWKPNAGGYAGQLFFFEIKLSTKPIVSGRGFRNLVEHLEFASDALECSIERYVFVTAGEISEFSKKFLLENRVHTIADANAPEDVVTWLRTSGALA